MEGVAPDELFGLDPLHESPEQDLHWLIGRNAATDDDDVREEGDDDSMSDQIDELSELSSVIDTILGEGNIPTCLQSFDSFIPQDYEVGQSVSEEAQTKKPGVDAEESPTTLPDEVTGEFKKEKRPKQGPKEKSKPSEKFTRKEKKPPYTYAAMCIMAIEMSEEKGLTVKEIRKALQDMFPEFFCKRYKGWISSVRFCLDKERYFYSITSPTAELPHRQIWKVKQSSLSLGVFRCTRHGYLAKVYAKYLHEQLGVEPVPVSISEQALAPRPRCSNKRKVEETSRPVAPTLVYIAPAPVSNEERKSTELLQARQESISEPQAKHVSSTNSVKKLSRVRGPTNRNGILTKNVMGFSCSSNQVLQPRFPNNQKTEHQVFPYLQVSGSQMSSFRRPTLIPNSAQIPVLYTHPYILLPHGPVDIHKRSRTGSGQDAMKRVHTYGSASYPGTNVGPRITGSVQYRHGTNVGPRITGSVQYRHGTNVGAQVTGSVQYRHGTNVGAQVTGSVQYRHGTNVGAQVTGSVQYRNCTNVGAQITGCLQHHQQPENCMSRGVPREFPIQNGIDSSYRHS